MSIEPQRLRAAIQLVSGSAPLETECARLGRTLGVIEEVLPWLVLRCNAFEDAPAFATSFSTEAKRVALPATRRQTSRVSSVARLNAERHVEAALGTLIADNITRREIATAAEEQVATLAGLSEYPGVLSYIYYRKLA
ncbi:hypothetical protein [Polymorphobacter fuscus]|uniref:Uncharacterized protein n=1 Tax=Sandarakinorhabdus fusca TaxID=1439888 RepID=A0A7C9KVF2_9SPHN|nr:hypothetical protein [Polymorphobacter fuscus]KAB7648368.1 hypothetical protein F9290_01205 [Polymorphobacter fuscus]MQT15882.1 hypothetical protein [Polymorphobacter fuscus]NJC07845.1 hypothetical protein [Polymorphobacter fuscus]